MILLAIPSFLNCLRAGESVKDPALWKKGGEALKGALAAFILSLEPVGKALGHDPHITPEVSGYLAASVVYVVGLFFTAATSKTVGLLPARAPSVAGTPGDGDAGGVPHAAAPVGGVAADTRAAAEVRPVDELTREAP